MPGLWKNFHGKLVHDHWKVYFSYDGCKHVACNAHHLRDVDYLKKQFQQTWAGEMVTLLVNIKNTLADLPPEQDSLSPGQIILFAQQYDGLVKKGLAENPYTAAKRRRVG
nr:transposase [Methylobacter sp. S3L5C]